jgi:hypothetical protein
MFSKLSAIFEAENDLFNSEMATVKVITVALILIIDSLAAVQTMRWKMKVSRWEKESDYCRLLSPEFHNLWQVM